MHSQDSQRALRVLWGVAEPPAHGPRARWTLASVAEAAVAIADAEGLAGVSLAKVAGRLELAPTALYRYVDSKATLVELMVDHAIGEVPTLTGRTWQQRCRCWVRELTARYRAHPWLTDHRPTGMPSQPRPFGWISSLTEAVAGTGLDGLRLALLLDGLVRTYAGIARGVSTATAPAAWLTEAIAERHPGLAPGLQRDWSNADEELGFAVDTVLRGLTAD